MYPGSTALRRFAVAAGAMGRCRNMSTVGASTRLCGINLAALPIRNSARVESHSILFSQRFISHTSTLLEQQKFPMPEVGDSISEGTIDTWHKKPGDAVAVDEVLCDVETDKVTAEVKASAAGVLVSIEVAEGDDVQVGQNLYTLDVGATGGVDSSEDKPVQNTTQTASEPAQSGVPTPFPMPEVGDGISEGTVINWPKSVGDQVVEGEVIAVVETDKLTTDVTATTNGVLLQQLVEEGDEVQVKSDLYILDVGATGGATSTTPESTVSATQVPAVTTPAAEKPTPKAAKETSQPSDTKSAAKDLASLKGSRNETRVKMTQMRKKVAQRLKDAQNTAAALTTFNEVDMTNLIALRKQYKDQFLETHGVKLGFMSAFVKAATVALMDQPVMNSVIDGNDILYRDYVDISVAVASPKGLVVPVLRNCETLDFAGVESEIARLAGLARDGKLGLEDMTGGTFTISNGGIYGSLYGTPIINPPQSAVLGMHATKDRPIAVNGKVEIRPMMYLALTYDHRVVDGREAVTFLIKMKECIEDPQRMLLGL